MSDLSEYGGEGAEAELRRRLGDHDFLVDLLQMGDEMRAFIETPVGTLLFGELKADVNRGVKGLLDQPNLGSPEAQLHFATARTAWAALSRIEECLQLGRAADSLIREMDLSEKVTP